MLLSVVMFRIYAAFDTFNIDKRCIESASRVRDEQQVAVKQN